MNIIEYIKMSFFSLKQNRMRTILTMIGLIVGISSIVTISILGTTIKDTVQNMVFNQSINTFRVYMRVRPDVINLAKVTKADCIQYEWLSSLQKEYPGEFKSSVSEFYDYVSADTHSKIVVNSEVWGITEGFFECNKMTITEGREISTMDLEKKKYTAVVSDVFVEQYFKSGTNPLGKSIILKLENKRTMKFTVVGVYKTDPYDFPGISDIFEKITSIYIPYDTAMQLSNNIPDYLKYVHIVGSNDIDRETLRNRLNDFFEKKYINRSEWCAYIYDVQKDAEATEKVVSLIIIIVGAIAAVSLIVAGVGVMNIMLVSISERTSEIGIRKSLGANNNNILIQFSLEAIMICLMGGFTGIIFGTINCNIIAVLITKFSSSLGEYASYIGEVSKTPDFTTILIAISFSCFVGLLSGIYPAMKAAKINPIDALRKE